MGAASFLIEALAHLLGMLGQEWARNSVKRAVIFVAIVGIPFGALFVWGGIDILRDALPAGNFGKALSAFGVLLFGLFLLASPFLTYYLRRGEQK